MKRIMILAAALALSACFGDKGNYDYHPLPEVTVTLVADMPAYAGEELQFTPEVIFADGDSEANYEYHWEQSMPMGSELVRQEGKTLKLKEATLGRKSWTLFVINKQTRVATMAVFYFNVQAQWGNGWLLLSDDGGQTTLNYIRPEYEDAAKTVRKYTSFPGLGANLGTQPRGLWQIVHGAVNPPPVMISQGSGSTTINGGTMLKELDLSEEFVGGMPAGFNLKQFVTNGYTNYILGDDGNVYSRRGGGENFIDEFANFPLEYQGRPLNVSQIIDARGYSGSGVWFVGYGFIDQTDKKMVWQHATNPLATNYGGMMPAVMGTTIGDAFDFNDFGDKIPVWVHVNGAVGMTSSPLRVIYKKGADYWLQQCALTTTPASFMTAAQVNVSATMNEVFVGSAYITDQTKFFQLETRDYLFFSTGNALYCYRPLVNMVHNIHTFAAGENVVAMASNPQESELGCYLSNGSFVTLSVTDSNLLNGEVVGRIDNLPGTPVAMIYKFLSGGAYSRRLSSAD